MTRNPVWTEDKGRAEDMLTAASLEQQDDVAESTAKGGKILVANCSNCGRQVKQIAPWGEVAAWFLGQRVAGSKATRQGVVVAMGCPCGRVSPMLIRWNEVKDFVEEGVQSGAIPPQIFQATNSR